MFLNACFFPVALINFFKIVQKFFFIWSPHLHQEMCPMSFYLVALINFSKSRFDVFFFLNVFLRPPSLDFGFFSDLKQRLNTVALHVHPLHSLSVNVDTPVLRITRCPARYSLDHGVLLYKESSRNKCYHRY